MHVRPTCTIEVHMDFPALYGLIVQLGTWIHSGIEESFMAMFHNIHNCIYSKDFSYYLIDSLPNIRLPKCRLYN